MPKQDIVLFYNGVFSQWHPCKFEIDSVEYSSAEQYMMAKKAQLFQDSYSLEKIMATDDPMEQKRLGRGVANFNKHVWEQVAREVVTRATLAKFTSDVKLRAALLATEGALLVEASAQDKIWGIGLDEADPKAMDPTKWKGTNWLGQVLTEVRDQLIALSCPTPHP